MDRIRLIAALTNGVLVLTLYTVAWGTPALDIAIGPLDNDVVEIAWPFGGFVERAICTAQIAGKEHP